MNSYCELALRSTREGRVTCKIILLGIYRKTRQSFPSHPFRAHRTGDYSSGLEGSDKTQRPDEMVSMRRRYSHARHLMMLLPCRPTRRPPPPTL